MSEHRAQLNWQRRAHPEKEGAFCRNHTLTLNGGQLINASSAASFMGDGECADPEQMLVAAVSSCHMLTFLAIAEIKGFTVESYQARWSAELNSSPVSGLPVINNRPRPSWRACMTALTATALSPTPSKRR